MPVCCAQHSAEIFSILLQFFLVDVMATALNLSPADELAFSCSISLRVVAAGLDVVGGEDRALENSEGRE